MKHCRKVKGKQVITLKMSYQLNTENVNIVMYQDNYSFISVKLNFCWRQTHCIDDQDKFQSVTDTDNDIGISTVNLHVFMKTSKSDISEVYKVQGDCLKDSDPDSYDKNDMKEKVNDLVRLHEAMQEKLKTASY